MQTSEVLNLAADLIEERGWTTGNEGRQRLGDESAPLCLEGAILVALGYDELLGAGFEALNSPPCPAARAVRDHLGRDEVLWAWNDEWDDTYAYLRTAAEVIEVLRACAVIEESRERQPAEVSA